MTVYQSSTPPWSIDFWVRVIPRDLVLFKSKGSQAADPSCLERGVEWAGPDRECLDIPVVRVNLVSTDARSIDLWKFL